MGLAQAAIVLFACIIARDNVPACFTSHTQSNDVVAGARQVRIPEFTGNAVDVLLTAEAALVWDVASNTILYEKNADQPRPVASLNKLVSVLTIRQILAPTDVVEIPSAAARAQRFGAHIKLPVGQRATVQDLLAASLIASANDAIVTLAVAASGSEEEFVEQANAYAASSGLTNTKLANATGFAGNEQYSTAKDMMRALQRTYSDLLLRPHLASEGGILTTHESQVRSYKTTNKLLGTYLPVLAAKTGYTVEAGENLAIITHDADGHQIGVVVLGSQQRFQDTKVLVEWIWRNYTWP